MILPHDSAPDARYGTAIGRWSGVGPYYAMFPVEFATAAIRAHTELGDRILDPFAGRATSLFAAAATDRVGIGMEISPVGWVYGKAKLQAAEHHEVGARLQWLGNNARNYSEDAKALPAFFHHCYCAKVRRFLLAARNLLDWRRNKIDWTTMALILVDLHGKREAALSNQMRQAKAMSPQYAIAWWKERELPPPERDPVSWLLKKIAWRYAKGRPDSTGGRVYLGDCRFLLASRTPPEPSQRASMLLTSPPYWGVTNYFYDQWLRLWMLGGPPQPTSTGAANTDRFLNKTKYASLLHEVFSRSALHLKRDAVIQVRTDARSFTRETTIQALETAFPKKKLRSERHTVPGFTQTELFDSEHSTAGEVDLLMW